MKPSEIKRQLANLKDERNGAFLYRQLAKAEKDPRLAGIYLRFAEAEDRHAAAWADALRSHGAAVPAFAPSWRTRVLAALARRLGIAAVLPTVTGMEQANAGSYGRQGDSGTMATEEASHARLLRHITTHALPGGLAGKDLARIEGRHRAGGGNALRAAVLGANDGLVSNLSLVMGVAGAELSAMGGHAVLITGLAGLLAGACSMALGEWLSVQSSRELYQRQIEIERSEIAAAPEEEAEELALIYQTRGVDPEQARRIARQIIGNHAGALETLAREELGIEPSELGGSAWVAAVTSFALFALGAIVPVIPFMILRGNAAVAASAAAGTAGLFLIGAAITLFTGRSALRSGLRMVLLGLAAAAVTFCIGRLIGAGIAG